MYTPSIPASASKMAAKYCRGRTGTWAHGAIAARAHVTVVRSTRTTPRPSTPSVTLAPIHGRAPS